MDKIEIKNKSYVIIKSSEVIEADSKKGIKYWQAHIVHDESGVFYTCTSSWSTTKDGLSKKNWSVPFYAEPKNIGKVNKTTNETQAYAEFESDVKKAKRVRESENPLPMLAQSFMKRKHKIKYPVVVQPKLDGNRMLTDGVDAWSRKNKPYIPEVIAHIVPLYTHGFILDGEIMLPTKEAVNVVNSAIKKFSENSRKLVYYVYDLISDQTYDQRYKILKEIVRNNPDRAIQIVPCKLAHSEEEVLSYHDEFVNQGYEGSIIRTLTAPYAIDKRVDDLLKHKDFITQEFLIVDIVSAGGGASEDVGKFVCKTDAGHTFKCTAMGTESERRELLENKENYIGKFATCKFREWTKTDEPVPFHGNILEIRDTKKQGY